MSQATSKMVEAFVRSRNRRALEKLRSNRMTLVDSFRSLQGLDLRKTVAGLEDEVAMVEAGIEKLNAPALVSVTIDLQS